MNQLALQSQPRSNEWARVALAMGAGLVAVALVLQVSYLAAGLLYAILFSMLAWQRPDLALMLIFALAPFQQDLSVGGPLRFSIGEINLAITAGVLVIQNLARRRPLRLSPMLLPAILYLLICYASSMLDWRGAAALKSILQMVLYLVVAVTVFASMVDRREQFLPALYGLVVVCTVLALMQIVGSGPYMMGLHKNGIGASMAAGFIVAVELWFATTDRRRRTLLTIALAIIGAGLIFSLSRGAWMAAAAGVGVIMAMRRQFRMMIRLALMGLPVLLVCWFSMPQEARDYAFGFEAERRNIQARYDTIEFAWDTFRQSPVIGTGIGLRKQADATNIILFTLAETGVIGLAAFLLFHAVFLRAVWTAQKYVPRNDPMYCLLAVGGAIVVSRLTHGLVDHYWSRGVLLIAWSAAGMATLACLTVRVHARRPQPLPPNSTARSSAQPARHWI